MNEVQIHSGQRSPTYSGSNELTIELAKMLALVAPSSMTAEQQEMWLRAAVDALEDIRVDEVRHVSAEVRRSVTRHNQIVPEIAKLVAERRVGATKAPLAPPLPEPPPRPPSPRLSSDEIEKMPKWLQETGLRVGFLRRDGGGLIDVTES